MVKVKVTTNSLRASTEDEARQLVAGAKVEYAICTVRGHKWPEVDPRKRVLPKGFVVGPIRSDRLYDITEHCQRCPETRHYLARETGIFGSSTRRSYTPPKDRPVLARDIARTFWADRLNKDEQLIALIQVAAQKATNAAERAAQAAEREIPGNVRRIA